MVIDLDPGEGVGFDQVKDAALQSHRSLEAIGLQSFALLTGGKGIHVVVPIVARAQWRDVRAFAKAFCAALAEAAPERFTISLPKEERRGRIFLDYLRNQRTATAVLPYSARARAGSGCCTGRLKGTRRHRQLQRLLDRRHREAPKACEVEQARRLGPGPSATAAARLNGPPFGCATLLLDQHQPALHFACNLGPGISALPGALCAAHPNLSRHRQLLCTFPTNGSDSLPMLARTRIRRA